MSDADQRERVSRSDLLIHGSWAVFLWLMVANNVAASADEAGWRLRIAHFFSLLFGLVAAYLTILIAVNAFRLNRPGIMGWIRWLYPCRLDLRQWIVVCTVSGIPMAMGAWGLAWGLQDPLAWLF